MLDAYLKNFFCLIFLLGLLAFCLKTCYKEILSPQTLAVVSFIPSLLLLVPYIKVWEADFTMETIVLLVFSPALFCVVTSFYYLLQKKKIKVHSKKEYKEINKIDNISFGNLLVMTFVEVLSILLSFKYMVSFVGSFSGLGQLFNSYRYKSTYIESAELPTIISLFRLVGVYSGFIWAYLICIYLIEKKKTKNLYIVGINYALSIIVSLSSGARGTVVMLFISTIVIYVFLLSQKRKNKKTVNKKINKQFKRNLYKAFIILVIIGLFFDKFANLLGRDTSEFSGIYYLAIYLSAPLKNLDIFIRGGCNGYMEGFIDNHTLSIFTSYFMQKYFNIHTESYIYPFNYINGHNLGNVATAYAAYIYDGGMAAVILFISIMAILSSVCFKYALKDYNKYTIRIDISVIIYSIMAFGILFNFFANEFYNTVINIEFFRAIIVIYLIRFFLEKFRIKWS